MRRAVFPWLGGFFLVCSIGLCLATFFVDAGERIVVSPRTHDIGTIGPVRSRVCTFQITNNFRQSLQLDVLTSCGCTSATFASNKLRPGQSTVLTCDLNLTAKRGKFVSTISVLYRSSENEQYTIEPCWIEGTVERQVELSPPQLSFHKNVAEKQRVKLIVRDPQIRVLDVFSSSKAANVSYDREQQLLQLDFDPSLWKDGPGEFRVTVVTDSKIDQNVVLRVVVLPPTSLSALRQDGRASERLNKT
ncbi:MAG TPA: DUF1573 domain-containing protein [Phycisphaerae bacterium]|nr:DUF1573 domain-containing protein [Phycisphaerae bacterium]